jgi:hypothetical protein
LKRRMDHEEYESKIKRQRVPDQRRVEWELSIEERRVAIEERRVALVRQRAEAKWLPYELAAKNCKDVESIEDAHLKSVFKDYMMLQLKPRQSSPK